MFACHLVWLTSLSQLHAGVVGVAGCFHISNNAKRVCYFYFFIINFWLLTWVVRIWRIHLIIFNYLFIIALLNFYFTFRFHFILSDRIWISDQKWKLLWLIYSRMFSFFWFALLPFFHHNLWIIHIRQSSLLHHHWVIIFNCNYLLIWELRLGWWLNAATHIIIIENLIILKFLIIFLIDCRF